MKQSIKEINSGYAQKYRREIAALLHDTAANGGFAPVDLAQFWADQQIAEQNSFGTDIPQLPLGIMMSGECVFDELGIPEDYWRYEQDEEWRLLLNRQYNDISEQIVGRRLLTENAVDQQLQYPPIKNLADVFEAKNYWHTGSWWLAQSAHDENELIALLDRVDACDIRSFILPEGWAEEHVRLQKLGVTAPYYGWQRGPVTFATSVFGVENLLYLILDNPSLAARFRDTILRVMLEIGQVMRSEAGDTGAKARYGFGFADDNCYLLSPEMYEFFALPILQTIFSTWAPNPGDQRFQHSDSAMGHLLPVLAPLNFTGVNFGPEVTVADIRHHMPATEIVGQLAPFTFSRNEEENMLVEFFRDFEMSSEKRGLRFATAGSINNGSRLSGMRLLMAAIQRLGRYQ